MKSDTGFRLAVILGLGLGLFSNGNLFVQGLLGVIIIVFFNLFINSDTVNLLINQPEKDAHSFSLPKYIAVNFLINSIIVFLIYTIVRLILNLIIY